MREVLIMRHAKSDWSDSSLEDFDRPINDRGARDAPRIGQFLKHTGNIPASIICSDAVRASMTADYVTNTMVYKNEISWNHAFYNGSAHDYLEAIKNARDKHERIMLIGHNPTIEQTCDLLCGGSFKMPTAAVACFEIALNKWNQLEENMAVLKWLMIPKVLNGIEPG